MYCTVTQELPKKTLPTLLMNNSKVINFTEVDKKMFTFEYTDNIQNLAADMEKLKIAFVMYCTNDDTYLLFKNTVNGMIDEKYPILEGVMKYHSDIIINELGRIDDKDILIENSYFSMLDEVTQKKLLSKF